MGNCGSAGDKEQKEKNKEIEKMIRNDKKILSEEIKILLLGTGESGKSTIAKQMKILHLKGFTPEEKNIYRLMVFHNVIRAAQILITQARNKGYDLEVDNEAYANLIIEIPLTSDINYSQEIGLAVKAIWTDAAIKKTFSNRSEFQLSDSAEYFLENCERFYQPGYVPNDSDILRVRAKTTGIVEIFFTIKKRNFRMVDVGGQRNERKKWIHCFQEVTAIIFCVAMSEYDLVLEEDAKVNRMQESLKLFNDIINSPWFEMTTIILFLNKKDLFDQKAVKVDLKICFPNYEDGLNIDKAERYIEKKFVEKNLNKNRDLIVHKTTATNTDNINVVFGAVAKKFLEEQLDELGLSPI